MGRHIIKQPNGKYAIWSTLVDNFIITDSTKEEYIEFRIKEETERIKKDLKEIFEKIEKGERYHYTVYQWEEALKVLEDVHGKKELKKVMKRLDE